MHKYLSDYLALKRITIVFILTIGCLQFGSGTYIYAKAQIAQLLLNQAWSKTLAGGKKVKPWDWADTYPIAEISFSNYNKRYIVLAGGTGRTMAFGPGHVSSSPLPGQGGNSVLVGHRDTHFAILEDLDYGDPIHIQLENKNINYSVVNSFITNEHHYEVMQEQGFEMLTLITCYPFNAIHTGGPLRYVIQAMPI